MTALDTLHATWLGLGLLGGLVVLVAVLGDRTLPPRQLAEALLALVRRRR